jgi:hypothetical protein
MDITAEEMVNALLDEVKRLIADNIALRIALSKTQNQE